MAMKPVATPVRLSRVRGRIRTHLSAIDVSLICFVFFLQKGIVSDQSGLPTASEVLLQARHVGGDIQRSDPDRVEKRYLQAVQALQAFGHRKGRDERRGWYKLPLAGSTGEGPEIPPNQDDTGTDAVYKDIIREVLPSTMRTRQAGRGARLPSAGREHTHTIHPLSDETMSLSAAKAAVSVLHQQLKDSRQEQNEVTDARHAVALLHQQLSRLVKLRTQAPAGQPLETVSAQPETPREDAESWRIRNHGSWSPKPVTESRGGMQFASDGSRLHRLSAHNSNVQRTKTGVVSNVLPHTNAGGLAGFERENTVGSGGGQKEDQSREKEAGGGRWAGKEALAWVRGEQHDGFEPLRQAGPSLPASPSVPEGELGPLVSGSLRGQGRLEREIAIANELKRQISAETAPEAGRR
eukprot:CAMPEP_0181334196 /NCGR_PEP_ID=MMETSP1101-20121128/26113_1 /TAXON_ID=46948 /ORGANISM="Rhodomonas abbreviata, Strain Caron Lab Isolate" /LENGTH=408 /DNA_ID=CAMNT_0023444121 /DNA_START=345 /DNA_END=1568 /DNA_ORIENTATION=-